MRKTYADSNFNPQLLTISPDKDENSLIYVAAILYNSSNLPIGVLTDLISDDFPKGTTIGFEATSLSLPDTISSTSIASYKIYAYPHQYQF